MDKILIIGTGGLAREFTSWFKDSFEIVGYSSNENNNHSEFNLPGILFNEDITPDIIGTDLAVMCIGKPVFKKLLYNKFSQAGFSFPSTSNNCSFTSIPITD